MLVNEGGDGIAGERRSSIGGKQRGVVLTAELFTTRIPLVPSDILRQVRPGEALLLHGTLRPAHLISRPYWRDRHLHALSDTAVPTPHEAAREPGTGILYGPPPKSSNDNDPADQTTQVDVPQPDPSSPEEPAWT